MEYKNNKKSYEVIIPEHEEIRDWFKVSSNRKKVWNVELWLLEELKKICEKHNIKYFADWWTLLWAIRHKWFIPRDDDMDFVMFREDYEKFREVAPKELPAHIKLCKYHQGFSKLVNINTAALWYENWWDDDFVGWIWIDIFPIDYASRFMVINYIKTSILMFLRIILLWKNADWFVQTMKKWKRSFVYLWKLIFKKISCNKIYNFHERISKKVLLKWEYVYNIYLPLMLFHKSIYNNSQIVEFENTTLCIPDKYEMYLKIKYWDYMTPVIDSKWHYCWYSAKESYKDIIKTFDESKSSEANYKNYESLFML